MLIAPSLSIGGVEVDSACSWSETTCCVAALTVGQYLFEAYASEVVQAALQATHTHTNFCCTALNILVVNAHCANVMCVWMCAQCIRARATTHFNRVFETCDVVVTPTTPLTAPPANPIALQSGMLFVATMLRLATILRDEMQPMSCVGDSWWSVICWHRPVGDSCNHCMLAGCVSLFGGTKQGPGATSKPSFVSI